MQNEGTASPILTARAEFRLAAKRLKGVARLYDHIMEAQDEMIDLIKAQDGAEDREIKDVFLDELHQLDEMAGFISRLIVDRAMFRKEAEHYGEQTILPPPANATCEKCGAQETWPSKWRYQADPAAGGGTLTWTDQDGEEHVGYYAPDDLPQVPPQPRPFKVENWGCSRGGFYGFTKKQDWPGLTFADRPYTPPEFPPFVSPLKAQMEKEHREKDALKPFTSDKEIDHLMDLLAAKSPYDSDER
jgi:hypothetical protein